MASLMNLILRAIDIGGYLTFMTVYTAVVHSEFFIIIHEW